MTTIQLLETEESIRNDEPLTARGRKPSEAGTATTRGMKPEWSDGAPSGMNPAIPALDCRLYGRMKCCCGKRMKARAQHKGGAYRVLCSCSCGKEEVA